MTPDELTVSVLIVNYNGAKHLPNCLNALAKQTVPRHRFEVIIVDNHSQDGGARFLRRLADRVELISLVENRLFLNHARGMRSGLTRLHELKTDCDKKNRANIVI